MARRAGLTSSRDVAEANGHVIGWGSLNAFNPRLGFTLVGVYREQGLLDGRWVDVLIMEKLL